MKILMLIFVNLFYLSISAQAVIFGHDSRIETKDATSLERELARSVPALVLKRSLKKIPSGDYTLAHQILQKSMRFCPEARFSDQTQTANCSSSLIAEDKILTAGHCLNEDSRMGCKDYYIIFDYALKEAPLDSKLIFKENVYECEEVLYNVFDPNFAEDIAVLKLKRKVEGRTPIEIDFKALRKKDQLFMIGYPLGIFQKVVPDGEVTQMKKKILSFRHNLDTFSVNSGGPIFKRSSGKQVGVLVRGTGTNFEWKESCYDWEVGDEEDFAEGNSLVHMKKILKRLK